MKVTFIYTPTEKGSKIEELYDEIPKFPNSDQYDYREYYKCLKAILKAIKENIEAQEKWHKDLKDEND